MKTTLSQQQSDGPVVIVGAGIAGLCAALRCSFLGLPVVVLEQAPQIGGKITQHRIGPRAIDMGPTVFTMRWVFEELFAACGLEFSDYVVTAPMSLLARHFWPDGAQLDLHHDLEASAAEIGTFAGIEAMRGYREFCGYAQQLYEATREPFGRSAKPSLRNLWQTQALADLGTLARIDALVTMRNRLQRFFKDPRLLQLFGRYATHCGGSPYQAPATLNLIAHVERLGVWRVKGGMSSLVRGVAAAAQSFGTQVFCNSHVTEILQHQGHAVGVRLSDGTQVDARAVIVNTHARALPSLLSVRPKARDTAARARNTASLSAVSCAWLAEVQGVEPAHHTVFFSDDDTAEFNDLFKARRVPQNPSIYVCAADRQETDTMSGPSQERILAAIHAPTGAQQTPSPNDIIELLAKRGLKLKPSQEPYITTPADLAERFSYTEGAIHGDAPHSWRSFFQRTGNRTSVSRLYLCGGAIHPGPGLPMTALNGQQAARTLAEDLGLTTRTTEARPQGS